MPPAFQQTIDPARREVPRASGMLARTERAFAAPEMAAGAAPHDWLEALALWGRGTHALGRVQILDTAGPSLCLRGAGGAERPRVVLLLQRSGAARVRQGERLARLGAGDLCLLRGAQPLELEQTSSFRTLLLSVPEAEFADRFPQWRNALAIRVSTDSGLPAVFRDLLESTLRWRTSLAAPAGERIADALVDLLGGVVCAAVPNAADCPRKARYHLDRIKEFARNNLADPDLSIDAIAQGVGLSARQIQRIFAEEPLPLMRWVLNQRLENCYRDLLRDPAGQRPIGQIAYAWGFNDQAHFSRCFRKHFGISPRDLRRGGRPAADPLAAPVTLPSPTGEGSAA